jgi:hypothetical protein
MKQANLGRLTPQGTVHRAAPSDLAMHCRDVCAVLPAATATTEPLPC